MTERWWVVQADDDYTKVDGPFPSHEVANDARGDSDFLLWQEDTEGTTMTGCEACGVGPEDDCTMDCPL